MKPFTNLTRLVRAASDPVIESKGPSSLTPADCLARGLGWFSFALGLGELLAPRRITGPIGMRGKEGLVRAYGLREIAAGILTLSVDSRAGLLARIAGDGLDLATLRPALRRRNRKHNNARGAALAVSAIMLLDIFAAVAVAATHRRSGTPRDYRNRTGLPKGVEASRGLAAK